MVQPNPNLLNLREQSDQEREYGRLRAQQRAAVPLITVLREQKEIRRIDGVIEIIFSGDDAVVISVRQQTASPEMLDSIKKRLERKGA